MLLLDTIAGPDYCIECKRAVKGKCSSCQIKELKRSLTAETQRRLQAEEEAKNWRCRALKAELKVSSAKQKIEKLRKDLNTSRKRVSRMLKKVR